MLGRGPIEKEICAEGLAETAFAWAPTCVVEPLTLNLKHSINTAYASCALRAVAFHLCIAAGDLRTVKQRSPWQQPRTPPQFRGILPLRDEHNKGARTGHSLVFLMPMVFVFPHGACTKHALSGLLSCAQVVALVKGMLKTNPALEAMTERVG